MLGRDPLGKGMPANQQQVKLNLKILKGPFRSLMCLAIDVCWFPKLTAIEVKSFEEQMGSLEDSAGLFRCRRVWLLYLCCYCHSTGLFRWLFAPRINWWLLSDYFVAPFVERLGVDVPKGPGEQFLLPHESVTSRQEVHKPRKYQPRCLSLITTRNWTS